MSRTQTQTITSTANKYGEKEKCIVGLVLEVPIKEKDEAKALGARFDWERKKWVVPTSSGLDAKLFSKWPVAADQSLRPNGGASQDRESLKSSFGDHSTTFVPSSTTDRIVAYTDGSCLGNQNVKIKNNPAGFGVVILRNSSRSGPENLQPLARLKGPVVTDRNHADFMGAEKGSNNTGELCAIGHCLRWMLSGPLASPERKDMSIDIRFDSTYAAKSISGEFNGKENRDLIVRVRELYSTCYSRLSGGRAALKFTHVKAHSGEQWNEEADRLAKEGSFVDNVVTIGAFEQVRTSTSIPSFTQSAGNTSNSNNSNSNSSSNNNSSSSSNSTLNSQTLLNRIKIVSIPPTNSDAPAFKKFKTDGDVH